MKVFGVVGRFFVAVGSRLYLLFLVLALLNWNRGAGLVLVLFAAGALGARLSIKGGL